MLIKYTVISSSLYDERQELIEHSVTKARQTKIDGWDKLENDHQQAWANIWKEMDVVISRLTGKHNRGSGTTSFNYATRTAAMIRA